MGLKILQSAPDGGPDSGVTAFFLIECKPLLSIALLRFAKGTREAHHSHAFNALTLWLWGRVREHNLTGPLREFGPGRLKFTPRTCFHKVEALTETWALTIRGPWAPTWQEHRDGKTVTLTHGRKEVPHAKGS